MRALPLLVGLAVIFGGCATMREAGPRPDAAALDGVLAAWGPAWSSGDVAKLLPLFTEDVYFEDVPLGAVTKDREALRNFAAGIFAGFANLRFEVTSRFVAADGKRGGMEWVFHGRQTKDFPGMPATNKPFRVRGASVVEFRDGKISRESDYWDLATYLKQVGLIK
jgi:steroid delta-isomerase-like uncharacterized protein